MHKKKGLPRKRLILEVFGLEAMKFIKFSTGYGIASALWYGTEPQINKEYCVELEIPDVLYRQQDIVSAEEKYLIATENNKFCLVGIFESIDDDGYQGLHPMSGKRRQTGMRCGDTPKKRECPHALSSKRSEGPSETREDDGNRPRGIAGNDSEHKLQISIRLR